jgi:hypothetical protein
VLCVEKVCSSSEASGEVHTKMLELSVGISIGSLKRSALEDSPESKIKSI